MAGVRIIAGEYAFPARSLAHARSLFRIHCVRWGCAPFSSAHSFVIPSGEDGGDDGVAVLRFAPRPVHRPVVRSVFSFRLYVRCSLFIHTVASKMTASFPVSPLASCIAPSNPPPRCPLPHSLRSSVSFLVSSCVSPPVSFSCRLAVRPVPRLVPSCPMCRTACRPSCDRAVLFSSSRRSPYTLSSSSPHDRMTQDGNGYRIMVTKRTSNRRTSRRKRASYLYRVDIGTRPTPQERPIQIRKAG